MGPAGLMHHYMWPWALGELVLYTALVSWGCAKWPQTRGLEPQRCPLSQSRGVNSEIKVCTGPHSH